MNNVTFNYIYTDYQLYSWIIQLILVNSTEPVFYIYFGIDWRSIFKKIPKINPDNEQQNGTSKFGFNIRNNSKKTAMSQIRYMRIGRVVQSMLNAAYFWFYLKKNSVSLGDTANYYLFNDYISISAPEFTDYYIMIKCVKFLKDFF